MRALREEGESGFIRTFASEYPRDPPAELWSRYEPYALLAESVLHRAANLGVQVKWEASLVDFSHSLQRAEVTILIAHWRSARFLREDFVFAEDASALGELNAELDREAEQRMQREALSLPARLAVEQLAWYSRRQDLEHQSPGRFRGGAGVQFAEGFQTIQRILNAIPSGWNRVLDLGVCQSILLGDAISSYHPEGLVLKTTDLTKLDFRLALVHQIVENLHREPQSYEAAVYEIRRELLCGIRERKKTR